MLTVYIDRIGNDFFFGSKSIFGLPPGHSLEATLRMTGESSLSQVDRHFFFLTSRQRLAKAASPLQTRLAFLSSTTLMRSRKAPHMLGHCRPPDHERKPQSET